MAFPTNYIKKRDTLHSEKTSKETLSRIGREFLAAERYSDALDFFEKAQDLSAVKEIKELALKSGDTFLLSRLDRFDRNLITREEWEIAAKKAAADGRGSMAKFVEKKFASADAEAAKHAALPGSAPLAEN